MKPEKGEEKMDGIVMESVAGRVRPQFELVVNAFGAPLSAGTVRDIACRHRAEVHSLVSEGARRVRMRLETTRVFDIVAALEALDTEVVGLVVAGR